MMATDRMCPACQKSEAQCACPPCKACGRSRAVCFEPVDKRFPARAVEAYAEAGYTFVPTCGEGQARDMKRTSWCWERARRDKYWTGRPVTDAERRGRGFATEAVG